jgi:hypothetical protein
MDAMVTLYAKLDRARELLPLLRTEIDDYYASDPIHLRLQHFEGPNRLEAVIESVHQPPLRLGVLMGDIVHNIRCALDHLVWQLALTRTPTPHSKPQFPILDNEPTQSAWRSRVATS